MATDWRQNYYRYQKYFLNIVALYKRRQDLKMFMEILLSLSAIALFGAFALRPTILTIITLTQDIKTKRETITKLDTKITNLQTAQIIYNDNLAALNLLETAIPDSPAAADIARQTEGLAKSTSTSVLGISASETPLKGEAPPEDTQLPPLPKDAQPLGLTINASGPYSNLTNLLSQIQNLRRPVSIDSLNFNLTDTTEESTIVMTIIGRFPYLKNER